MQIAHAPVHDPESARMVLREAARIASELEADGVPYTLAFQEAARLLGARASVPMMPQPVPLPGLDLASMRPGR